MTQSSTPMAGTSMMKREPVYYGQLTHNQKKSLRNQTSSIKEGLTAMKSNLVKTGRRLREAKRLVGYGFWGHYLKAEIGISRDTADRMIDIAKAVDEKQLTIQQVESLPITSLYAVIKKSTPEAAKREIVSSSTSQSTEAVDEIVQRHRAPSRDVARREYKQRTLDKMKKDLARMRQKLEPFDDTLAIVKEIAKVEDEIAKHLRFF